MNVVVSAEKPPLLSFQHGIDVEDLEEMYLAFEEVAPDTVIIYKLTTPTVAKPDLGDGRGGTVGKFAINDPNSGYATDGKKHRCRVKPLVVRSGVVPNDDTLEEKTRFIVEVRGDVLIAVEDRLRWTELNSQVDHYLDVITIEIGSSSVVARYHGVYSTSRNNG